MSESDSSIITQLLQASAGGDETAIGELLPLVYAELRRMAQAQISHERPGHTLSATALVHEAYLKLVGQASAGWRSKADFYGVAAKAMKRILIDHARRKKSQKRGGTAERIALNDEVAWFEERGIDLEDLNAALDRLAHLDPDQSQLIELRFFCGLNMPQVAELLNRGLRTVERDWTHAKAWLRAELKNDCD